jgi:EAL and modified HD-GYP domain-containing signal transduction protein
MTPEALAVPGLEAVPERAGGLRYMARQPILDVRGQVHAYELLFRDGLENSFRGTDLELASRTIVDNIVIFGLQDLSGGLPAFVNCTDEVLTADLASALPPQTTVLEILETVEPTAELVQACRKFKAQGFRIALDDFIWDPKFAPLVEVADYIKVDFLGSHAAERQEVLRNIYGSRAKLVAEKVETLEEFNKARSEGFTLFQGYYFCRPVMLEKRKIPANRLHHLEILQLLHAEPMDFRRLVPLVKSDASLTHRLLRLVNSAGYGVRQEIRSIQSALVIVGEDTFRRIATLAIASELNTGQPAEILRMALVRGRFCELAASLAKLCVTEQYLVGLLSLFPAMLQVPMDQLTPMFPLRPQIRESLNGAANPERCLLAWIEAHERGDWRGSDAIAQAAGLNGERLYACYAEAVPWAWAALRSAS